MTSTICVPDQFQCLECKTRISFEEAEEIVNGDERCPGCGGCDIDIAVD